MHGADGLIRNGPAVFPRKARDAEIHDLDGAVLQQHDVLRLDIAVYDPVVVRMLQSPEDLDRKMDGLFPSDRALLPDVLLQRNAVDILHAVAEIHIEYPDDIRMRQHGDRLRLVAETAAELLVVEVLFLEDLDRDMPVFQQIVGLEYDGHTAEPNEL